MSCCIERAFAVELQTQGCTLIDESKVFVNIKKCENCMPYAVVRVTSDSEQITSDVTQLSHTIAIAAYFHEEADALAYKQLIEAWLTSERCLPLSTCGCLCLRRISGSTTQSQGNLTRYSVTVRGTYRESDSGSASESV